MIEVFKKAQLLPLLWDKAVGNNFALYKSNLILLEEVNPCNQTYVIFRSDEIYGIMVQYELKINIFSYSKCKFNIPITIIGIPCSVCEPGYSIKYDYKDKLNKNDELNKNRELNSKYELNSSGELNNKYELNNKEELNDKRRLNNKEEYNNREEVSKYITGLKGAKLILNADEDLDFLGFAKGYTLPTCILKITWGCFNDYLFSLRSHYRYRYKKAIKKAENLCIERLKDNFDFNPKHYSLYEQVYNTSQYKLEKLTIDFFKKSSSSIIEFKLLDEPIAFIQYTIVQKQMVFLFGGINYSLNAKYDLYLNMLLYLVRIAIENNCTLLNLGQTAEEMKCKLGAYQEKKYLYMHHSSAIINRLVSKFNKFFSYKMKDLELKVLKR